MNKVITLLFISTIFINISCSQKHDSLVSTEYPFEKMEEVVGRVNPGVIDLPLKGHRIVNAVKKSKKSVILINEIEKKFIILENTGRGYNELMKKLIETNSPDTRVFFPPVSSEEDVIKAFSYYLKIFDLGTLYADMSSDKEFEMGRIYRKRYPNYNFGKYTERVIKKNNDHWSLQTYVMHLTGEWSITGKRSLPQSTRITVTFYDVDISKHREVRINKRKKVDKFKEIYFMGQR